MTSAPELAEKIALTHELERVREENAALRRELSTATHESEENTRFRELAEAMPQLVWTCTADGACDYLGPQWVEYTGTPESEQLGSAWLEKLHPDDRERVNREWTLAAS
ncbi:MAG TPA: PAS domain-containing protein, partial [Polyangiaceae bacterium]|nr:PAS domain-containing protein [Polyangiaceae bacterium]